MKRKLFLVFTVAILGLFALPNEVQAGTMTGVVVHIGGVPHYGNVEYHHFLGTTYYIIFTGINLRTGERVRITGFGTIWPPPGGHKGNLEEMEEVEIRLLEFNIRGDGNNVEVSSTVDCTYDIYEVATGKLLSKDNNLIGGSYQSTQQLSDAHYLIQFKINGVVVSQQTFIYHNNQLFKGGNSND